MAKSLLPSNATQLEKDLEQASARVEEALIPIRSLWRPSDCPAELLPWLAWALSVDAWGQNWSESIKRKVLEGSFAKHRVKGTPGALKEALQAIDADLTHVEEWFEYSGAPYTFRVQVDLVNRPFDLISADALVTLVLGNKNLRSFCERIRIKSIFEMGSVGFIAGVGIHGSSDRLYPLIRDNILAACPVHHGLATASTDQALLYPKLVPRLSASSSYKVASFLAAADTGLVLPKIARIVETAIAFKSSAASSSQSKTVYAPVAL